MPHHFTSLDIVNRAGLTHIWRRCTDHAAARGVTFFLFALLLVGVPAARASAATYFVDPQNGSDTNNGTSTGSPWETIPGTRTTDNTGFLRSQWGGITQANKIACGDTILLKGGTTHSTTTVTKGGAVRIDPSYYANTCTAAAPITIRVATGSQWSGSSGPYAINGAGMVVTSLNYSNADGSCQTGGYCALVTIENLDGVIFGGISDSQRIILTSVAKSLNDGAKTAGLIVQGKGAGIGKHIQLAWLDISNKSAYDNGYGLEVVDVGLSWVHDILIHDWQGGGVDTSMMTTWHRVQGLVLEKVTVTNTGNRSNSVYPVSDDYYFAGGEFSDARAGGGVWCLNCVGANGYADGSNSFGCNGVNEDGLVRFRDSAFYGNGRNTALSTGNGIESAGDSVTTCATGSTGNALPEQTVVTIRAVIYDNRRAGLSMPHNAGSHYAWHDTLFRAGSTDTALSHNECASSVGVFNTIIDMGSSTSTAFGIVNCGTAEGSNKTAPVLQNTLWHGPSGTEQLSQFRTFCRNNDNTWTTTPCSNGSCPSGQTCRTDYSSSVLCQPPCTGQSFVSPIGAALGSGNVLGTQDTKFVSAGGGCDTDFSDGAPNFKSCDFHLQSGSPAIDPAAPLYVLLANGGGNNASTITVKASTPEPEQMKNIGNYSAIKLAWGSRPHIADPRTYFVGPQNHPWAIGDIVQMVGTCTNGAARYGAAGRARIVSMTSNSITVDDTCTWADGAGVHWPFNGASPDLGAFEFGLSTGVAAPTLLSVDPIQ